MPRSGDGSRATAFKCTTAVEDTAATTAAIETHGRQLTTELFEIEQVGDLRDVQGHGDEPHEWLDASLSGIRHHQNSQRNQFADANSRGEDCLVVLTRLGP